MPTHVYRSSYSFFHSSLVGAEATYVCLRVQCYRGHQFWVHFSKGFQILELCLLFFLRCSPSHHDSKQLTFCKRFLKDSHKIVVSMSTNSSQLFFQTFVAFLFLLISKLCALFLIFSRQLCSVSFYSLW